MLWTMTMPYADAIRAFADAAAAGGGYAPEALQAALRASLAPESAIADLLDAAEAAAGDRHANEHEARCVSWRDRNPGASDDDARDYAVSKMGPRPAQFDRLITRGRLEAVAYGTGSSRAVLWPQDGAWIVGVEVDPNGWATGMYAARCRAAFGDASPYGDAYAVSPFAAMAAHAAMVAELRERLARCEAREAPAQHREPAAEIFDGGPAPLEID